MVTSEVGVTKKPCSVILFTILAITSAGCGGAQPPIGAAATTAQSRAIAQHAALGKSWMLPEAKNEDLLYVSSPSASTVDVFSYPKGKLTGRLEGLLNANGLCSDAAGNVWVEAASVENFELVEFTHGGTKPIATLAVPGSGAAPTCSVDPSTGNLAAAYDNVVFVYQGAQGEPTSYNAFPLELIHSVTYDSEGNLFAYGLADGTVTLGELPRGGSSFTDYSLDEGKARYSFAQWDGQYIAVAGLTGKLKTGDETIWRVAVSESRLTVVGTVTLKSYKGTGFGALGWIEADTVIQPNKAGSTVASYRYPKGGGATSVLSGQRNKHLSGVTVSVAPNN